MNWRFWRRDEPSQPELEIVDALEAEFLALERAVEQRRDAARQWVIAERSALRYDPYTAGLGSYVGQSYSGLQNTLGASFGGLLGGMAQQQVRHAQYQNQLDTANMQAQQQFTDHFHMNRYLR